ncbi:MAG: indole-3-glycerol phosphate synthase TrpC [Janthinobacterium lividum]
MLESPLAPNTGGTENESTTSNISTLTPPLLGAGGTILDAIIAHKHTEIQERQVFVSQSELTDRAAAMPPPRDFLAALQTPKVGSVALIAEVKKASPSAGIIRADFDPVAIARIYEANGASCLSVLTDEKFFQGHDDFLIAVREAIALPIIRKDFIINNWQIYESRALGADAVLLIVAALSPTQIADYQAIAHGLGMAALVEVHTEAEMEIALGANAKLIGINSRNLNTFVTDLGMVETLAAMVPTDVTLVAESGLKTPADVKRVAEAGAKAILVGETLMRASDIGAAVRELLG